MLFLPQAHQRIPRNQGQKNPLVQITYKSRRLRKMNELDMTVGEFQNEVISHLDFIAKQLERIAKVLDKKLERG